MKQNRADLDPPKRKSGDDHGHVWLWEEPFDVRSWKDPGVTCLYCGCAQTAKEAQQLCRNLGSEKRLA